MATEKMLRGLTTIGDRGDSMAISIKKSGCDTNCFDLLGIINKAGISGLLGDV